MCPPPPRVAAPRAQGLLNGLTALLAPPACSAVAHLPGIFGVNESTPGYEGIVVGLWAPAAASTPLGEIEIETEYPFVLGY